MPCGEVRGFLSISEERAKGLPRRAGSYPACTPHVEAQVISFHRIRAGSGQHCSRGGGFEEVPAVGLSDLCQLGPVIKGRATGFF